MRNFYLSIAVFITGLLSGQTTIYSENFGAGGTSNTPVTTYTGYQNSTITYSGTADIRTSLPSSGYTGSSGAGCVFLGGTTAAPEKSLLIEGINTKDYTDLVLSIGHQKGTNASSNELTIEVYDGQQWTLLSYTRPTGNNTSNWILVTPAGAIPSIPDLKIRITNPLNSNVGFRIDDIKITGSLTLAVQDVNQKHFNIYPTVVNNGVINIVSKNDGLKHVKIFDMSAKLILENRVKKEINVQNLKKGNYIVSVEENGKTKSQKIIIK